MFGFYKNWQGNKLWNIFLGHKKTNLYFFSGIIFFNFIAALFEGFSFGFLATALTGFQADEDLQSKFLRNLFFPDVQGIKLFFFSIMLAIAFQILRSGLCYFSTVFSMRLAYKIQTEIQTKIYNQILQLSYGYITRLKIGDLLEGARSPVYFIYSLVECLNRFVVSFLTSIVIISLMFLLDFRLASITLLLFCLFALIQKSIIKTIMRSSDSFSKHLMASNQDTSQMLQGIKVIHTFFQQAKIREKIREKIKEIGMTGKKVNLLVNIIPYLNEIISILVLGIILATATLLIGLENPSFLAILMTFLTVSYRLSTRVQIALSTLATVSGYYGHLLRTNDILEDGNKEFLPQGGIALTEPLREITFDSIHFRYNRESEEVLKGVSFAIPKGAMVGIVGLSGSGKTSLIDLLLRLYDPTEGKICANRQDIKEFSLETWRNRFGVVAQDSFLFDETIEENIRFGLDKVPFSQVEEAAKSAGISDLIERLPDGYRTLVGERGVRLSGGERQRIALARALLRDPEVLILDEATSNLDSQSELYIQNALERLQKRKTILVIAHRLSTIVHSDFIILIEKGVLSEIGTHETLLKRGGRYSHLWELQTKKQNEMTGNSLVHA